MPALPERLRSSLDRFVGERHLRGSPRRHAAAGDLVGESFVTTGLEVSEQPVVGPHGTGCNLIGRLVGCGNPKKIWVLGAHYDTVEGSPGADDNGVAVAALMEAARSLQGRNFRDTIELVAWDLEEFQGLQAGIALGSRVMAREARRNGQEIAGVLDLEMIGCCREEAGSQRFPAGFGALFPELARWIKERESRGDFLAVVSNSRSHPLAEAFAAAAEQTRLPLATVVVRGAARLIPAFYRSDHVAFWWRGIPALMLTDSADFRNEHYHRPTDTVDTLDFDFAARVLETAVETVGRLAGQDQGR
jgi:Zn-dependent M28 family amino/carboxypeptidase